MKSFINLLVTLSVLTFSSLSFSATEIRNSAAQVSVEQSVLLLDARTQSILSSLKKDLAKKKQSLRVVQFSTLVISEDTVFTYLSLEAVSKSGESISLGSIVGNVIIRSNGQINIDGIFFKPAETIPGGATVGN